MHERWSKMVERRLPNVDGKYKAILIDEAEAP
jgi:hypothetical protein